MTSNEKTKKKHYHYPIPSATQYNPGLMKPTATTHRIVFNSETYTFVHKKGVTATAL